MNLPIIFKRLVIGSVVIYVAWIVLPWIQWPLVSEDVLNVLSWRGADAVVQLPVSVFWLAALLYIPTAIGLCNFSPSARWLFVALTLCNYAAGLVSGMAVDTALGATLGHVVSLADGAIIALAYMTPLKHRFEGREEFAEPTAPPNGGPTASADKSSGSGGSPSA